MTRVPACQCIEATNAALTEHRLTLATVVTFSGGELVHVAALNTAKYHPRSRKVHPRVILASYCPFCGMAYVEPGAVPS